MSSANDEDYESQEGSGDEQNSNGDHDAQASGLRLSGKKSRYFFFFYRLSCVGNVGSFLVLSSRHALSGGHWAVFIRR